MKRIVKKERKKEAYFCPFCKRVFDDTTKDSAIKEECYRERFMYQCKSCKKPFNQDTYKENCSPGRHYHYIQHSKKTVQEKISEHIIKLLLAGEGNKNIQHITHFSREMIDKILKSYFNDEMEYTFNNFKREYLKEGDSLYENLTNAIKKGCSYRITCKLYNVTNRSIKKELKSNKVTIDYSVKISLKNERII